MDSRRRSILSLQRERKRPHLYSFCILNLNVLKKFLIPHTNLRTALPFRSFINFFICMECVLSHRSGLLKEVYLFVFLCPVRLTLSGVLNLFLIIFYVAWRKQTRHFVFRNRLFGVLGIFHLSFPCYFEPEANCILFVNYLSPKVDGLKFSDRLSSLQGLALYRDVRFIVSGLIDVSDNCRFLYHIYYFLPFVSQ